MGHGLMMRGRGHTAVAEPAPAMVRCPPDVTSRIPAAARLYRFTQGKNAERPGWNAGKHRPALDRPADGGLR